MADTPIGPGTVLAGRFVLEDLLDEFDGARFWRATDQILARDVAVHVIASTNPRAAAMLSAARTSATVSDGHLLRVLDAATVDGVTYVVNEWGHGISLDHLLAEGPLSPRRAAWVVKEVAEAISTAHRQGIAHGRLLPENVVVTESGSVKLIGFVVDAVLRGRESERVTGGAPLGEHEADVVNLGALLYASLVARWPGTDGSSVPVAPAEHGRPLRPRQVRAGVPRPLDAICERVLGIGGPTQTLPIQTAHEVYAALCDYIGDPLAGAALGEPTSLLGSGEITDSPEGPPGDGETPGEQTELAPRAVPTADPGDPPVSGHDPESTQIGVPTFDDDHAATVRDPEATRVVPPPPTLSEPAPRPLFASSQPRPRPAEPAWPRSTGAIPEVWGPDADTPPPAGGALPADDFDEPPGRSWLRLAGAIAGVLVLVLAIVFAFNLGRGSILPEDEPAAATASEDPAPDAPEPVDIATVADFDPEGDGQEENPETAPLSVDGNPGTAWRTSTYFDPLSQQKSGVGLMVDLGKPVELADVRLTLVGWGTDLQLLAAPDATTAPTALDQLQRIAGADAAGTEVTLTPDEAVTTQYLVVWLTELPTVEGGFRGQVAEIAVRS